MRRIWNRWLSLLLVVSILTALFPLPALANSAEETTYAAMPTTGIIMTLLPAENKVCVSLNPEAISEGIVICALYQNGKMISCVTSAEVNTESNAFYLSYSGIRPPVCKTFIVNEQYAPIMAVPSCDLFSQAYRVEDGTFDYIMAYNERTVVYDAELDRLQSELDVLEEQKAVSEEKVTQAELDLNKLPSKRNGYIQGRISYYVSSGVGGSQIAIELANRDWNDYYTRWSAEYRTIITTENANIRTYTRQISEKEAEITALSNDYQADVYALKREHPNASTGVSGGTYESDHYTYDEAYDMITERHREKVDTLQKRLDELVEARDLSETAILQAELDLINLPTQKNGYIENRVSYYVSTGIGGSQYALEAANKDWDDYYTAKTTEYNAIIVREEANVASYEEDIADIQEQIDEENTQYNLDIAELKKRYGIS